MTFTDDQKKMLSAKLDSSHVQPPKQYGPKGSYIEGWHAIAEANRIFGFDGWSYEVVNMTCVGERDREIGSNKKPGFGVTYTAHVRVVVGGIIREDVGAGHGYDVDAGLAHESAIKEAVTDALKRTLKSFGNPFGLALYDKSQENVERHEAPAPKPKAQARDLYAELEKEMRMNQSKAALKSWISEPDVKERRMQLPKDWDDNLKKAAADHGRDLPDTLGGVVQNIMDTFPGATVTNERQLHPLEAGE